MYLQIIVFSALVVCIHAISCSQCISDATQVEQRLANLTVQLEIGEYLNETICQHLVSPEKTVCGQIVIVDLPKIIDIVIQRYSPDVICKKLGYC